MDSLKMETPMELTKMRPLKREADNLLQIICKGIPHLSKVTKSYLEWPRRTICITHNHQVTFKNFLTLYNSFS